MSARNWREADPPPPIVAFPAFDWQCLSQKEQPIASFMKALTMRSNSRDFTRFGGGRARTSLEEQSREHGAKSQGKELSAKSIERETDQKETEPESRDLP